MGTEQRQRYAVVERIDWAVLDALPAAAPYHVAVYVAQHDRTVRYDADDIPDCCALVAAGAAEVTVYSGPTPVDHFNTFLW